MASGIGLDAWSATRSFTSSHPHERSVRVEPGRIHASARGVSIGVTNADPADSRGLQMPGQSISVPLSYLPNHTEPVQAKDLLDSLIVVTQLLHREGNLRIIADVLDFARQFRAAI